MITENVLSQEMAEIEFDRWAEAMDLDLDESFMDEDDLGQFRKHKRRILSALSSGALVITDDGEASYTPQNPKSKHKEGITFHERTGASVMAMDGKKKGHDIAKTYAVMADMCKVHPSVFAGLVGLDGKVCESLFTFLMD